MKKVSIGEAAEILGISKEAVYNRIRRNSLRAEESGGVRYVLLDDAASDSRGAKSKTGPDASQDQTAQNQSFIDYLIKEVAELKGKIEALQEDKDRLHKEKEEILIASKEEIKLMYKERDEKLGKRIRDAQLQKVPYMIVIGDKEKEARVVAVRERSKGDLGSMDLEAFRKLLDGEFNPSRR